MIDTKDTPLFANHLVTIPIDSRFVFNERKKKQQFHLHRLSFVSSQEENTAEIVVLLLFARTFCVHL